MPVDLTQFMVGGATRPDSLSGFRPEFSSALAQMFAAAPENIRGGLRISSGYRSPDRQAQLWEQALQKYGSPEAARKWVAPPGRSNHNHGQAADLKYLSPEALKWAHANAGQFGLAFPLSNENWHVELASARGGNAPAPHNNDHGAKPTAIAVTPQQAVQPSAPGQAAPMTVATAFNPNVAPDPAGAPTIQAAAFAPTLAIEERRKRQQQEAEDEQARRLALFGGGGVASMFG